VRRDAKVSPPAGFRIIFTFDEGFAEGFKQGFAQGLAQARQERIEQGRAEALDILRASIRRIAAKRFPELGPMPGLASVSPADELHQCREDVALAGSLADAQLAVSRYLSYSTTT
jgi:hypothetical protein